MSDPSSYPSYRSRESAPAANCVAAWRRLPFHLLTAAALWICASPAVHAQAPSTDFNRFEITPFIGFAAGGDFEDPVDASKRTVEDSTSWGLIFDIAADRDRHYEFLYSRQGTDVSGATPMDLDIEYLHLGGTVAFPETRYVVPYFGMTVGATRFSPDESGFSNETELSFSVAGGMKIPITARIGLRLDVRAFVTLLDSDSDIFCISDPPVGACRIRTRSDTFLQYTGTLGITAAF